MSTQSVRPWVRTAAAVAACALLAAACDSGKKHGAASSPPSSSGLTPSSAASATRSGPAPSGAALRDPGAFATNLDFTDISKQVNNALNGVTSRKLSFARAVMKVPLDWAHPDNGKTVSITVLRVRSQSQHNRIGSLVVNPGGPGGSGTEAALDLAVSELPQAILDRFDIVGFDPRGVALSDPIKCIPAKEKDAELNLPPDPTTDAQWQANIDESKKVADECYSIYGNDLTFFSTAETVRDMEALRAKLGDSKLTYLGYSYGTLSG